MAKEQTKIWEMHIENMQWETLKESVEHPAIFQQELRDVINPYVEVGKKRIIEVGCEAGVSSLILFSRIILTKLY